MQLVMNYRRRRPVTDWFSKMNKQCLRKLQMSDFISCNSFFVIRASIHRKSTLTDREFGQENSSVEYFRFGNACLYVA